MSRFTHPTAFTTTKYLVNDDFADLLALQEPCTRKEVQVAFINYAINHDFADFKTHHYLIYRHHRLKVMLGADTLHPKNLFKYLRKMLMPIQRPLTDDDVEKIRLKSMYRRAERRKLQTLFLKNPAEALRLGYASTKAKAIKGEIGEINDKQLALK